MAQAALHVSGMETEPSSACGHPSRPQQIMSTSWAKPLRSSHLHSSEAPNHWLRYCARRLPEPSPRSRTQPLSCRLIAYSTRASPSCSMQSDANCSNSDSSRCDISWMWSRHVSTNAGNTTAQPTGQVFGTSWPSSQLWPASLQQAPVISLR